MARMRLNEELSIIQKEDFDYDKEDLSVMLSISMMASLVACGGGSSTPSTTAAASGTTAASEAAAGGSEAESSEAPAEAAGDYKIGHHDHNGFTE